MKKNYYWQSSVNGVRHYVSGLEWLTARAKDIRLLHIFPIQPPKKETKLIAYLDDGKLFYAVFDTYESAKRFVIRAGFNQSNKEIQSI